MQDLVDGLGKGFVKKQYAEAVGAHLVLKYQPALPHAQTALALERQIIELKAQIKSIEDIYGTPPMPLLELLCTHCASKLPPGETWEGLILSGRLNGFYAIGPPSTWNLAELSVVVWRNVVKLGDMIIYNGPKLRQREVNFLTIRLASLNTAFNRAKDRAVAAEAGEAVGAGEAWRGFASEAPLVVVCRCPTDGCRGTVTKADGDVTGSCSLCTKLLCLLCHEAYESGHECDAQAAASVRLMLTDTKPCPNCSVPINRSWGCDQMCCTQCQTVFSWASGRVVDKNALIHNPYALAFRAQARLAAQAPECDVPTWEVINERFHDLETWPIRDRPKPDYPFKKYAVEACTVLSCSMEELHRAWHGNHIYGRVNFAYSLPETRNSFDLHVKYLDGKLSDAAYAKELLKRHRHLSKLEAFDTALGSYYDSARVIFHSTWLALGSNFSDLTDEAARDAMRELVSRMEELKRVMRGCMSEIARVYDCQVPVIDAKGMLPCHSGVCLGWNQEHSCFEHIQKTPYHIVRYLTPAHVHDMMDFTKSIQQSVGVAQPPARPSKRRREP